MRRKQKGPDAALIAMLLSGALAAAALSPALGQQPASAGSGQAGRKADALFAAAKQAMGGAALDRITTWDERGRLFRGRAFRHLRDSGGPAGAEAGIELCARPGQGWAGLGRAESVDHGCERPGARGDVARGRSGRDPAGVYFHQRVPVSRPLAGRDELRRPENCRWRQLRCSSGDTEGCRAAGNLVRSCDASGSARGAAHRNAAANLSAERLDADGQRQSACKNHRPRRRRSEIRPDRRGSIMWTRTRPCRPTVSGRLRRPPTTPYFPPRKLRSPCRSG